LCRAGWLGSQRYAASIWSGDIDSTFESLQEQIRAGLNMALSGIPWWNTDIGGFKGGNIDSDYFRELIVRWFQYGVFCPVCRLHGVRGQFDISNPTSSGATTNSGHLAMTLTRSSGLSAAARAPAPLHSGADAGNP